MGRDSSSIPLVRECSYALHDRAEALVIGEPPSNDCLILNKLCYAFADRYWEDITTHENKSEDVSVHQSASAHVDGGGAKAQAQLTQTVLAVQTFVSAMRCGPGYEEERTPQLQGKDGA